MRILPPETICKHNYELTMQDFRKYPIIFKRYTCEKCRQQKEIWVDKYGEELKDQKVWQF